ncbi:hypothetical protein N9J98_02120 [Flavobacteriaceae bacterium]|nr:hypothetical protein [Flavobacteriaceae bacterium]
MKKHILIFLMLIIPLINSFSQDNNRWMLNSEKSSIEYNAKHLLHNWNAINKNVKGVFFIDENKGKIAVSANIAEFDSGISNRDSNTLRVLNVF